MAGPADYAKLPEVLAEFETIKPGDKIKDLQRVVVTKRLGSEDFMAVFEVRPAETSRSLVFKTLVIKQAKKRE